MSEIDRQRIAAVRKLEELGYRFTAGEWVIDVGDQMIAVGDGCYRMVVKRPADLDGRTPGPREGEPVVAWEWIAGRYPTVPMGDGFYSLLMHREDEVTDGREDDDGVRESMASFAARSAFESRWKKDFGWDLRTAGECSVFGRGAPGTA